MEETAVLLQAMLGPRLQTQLGISSAEAQHAPLTISHLFLPEIQMKRLEVQQPS